MATITVRDLDEGTRDKLRIRAARNGRSMEAEVRAILRAAVAAEPSDGAGIGSRIRALFAEMGGADEVFETIASHRDELRRSGLDAPRVAERS
jgi:antitoxin FitA